MQAKCSVGNCTLNQLNLHLYSVLHFNQLTVIKHKYSMFVHTCVLGGSKTYFVLLSEF